MSTAFIMNNYRRVATPEMENAAAAVSAYFETVEPLNWTRSEYDYHGAELAHSKAGIQFGPTGVALEDGLSYAVIEAPSGDVFSSITRHANGTKAAVLLNLSGGTLSQSEQFLNLWSHFTEKDVEISRFRNPPDDLHPVERFPHGWSPVSMFTQRGTVYDDPVRGYRLELTNAVYPYELSTPDGETIGHFDDPEIAELYATAHSEGLELRPDLQPSRSSLSM